MHTIFLSLLLLPAVIILCYAVLILVHILSWEKLPFQKKTVKEFKTKVSIIIAARNEEENIAHCLTSLLEQDYPHQLMEIIVCDDYSTDGTKDAVNKIFANSPVQNKYVCVTSSPSNKKKAIEAGIMSSSGELLIFTDADCTAETTWISSMVNAFEETGVNMLCGPVVIQGENSLCERFQGLEMCGLSLLSGAGINAGIPLLCNGANIAYTRAIFDEVEGFKGIEEKPTGDDTLMMFKINNKYPGSVKYVKTGQAFVYTPAQAAWKDLFQQRIRWASKGLHSKNAKNSIVSLLVFLSNFLLLVYAILTFIYPISIPILVGSFILKSLVDFLLLTFASVFFKKRELLLIFPVSEIITIFYTSLVGLVAPYWHYQWKGRNY